MTTDLINPTLSETNDSSATLARQLLNEYELSPKSIKDAAGIILLLRAQSNIANYNIEPELDKLSEFINRYKALTNALNKIAGE